MKRIAIVVVFAIAVAALAVGQSMNPAPDHGELPDGFSIQLRQPGRRSAQ